MLLYRSSTQITFSKLIITVIVSECESYEHD